MHCWCAWHFLCQDQVYYSLNKLLGARAVPYPLTQEKIGDFVQYVR
jgi:hypothetical protein